MLSPLWFRLCRLRGYSAWSPPLPLPILYCRLERRRQTMSIPRDHHFIPAFYLRQWGDHTGKLIEYTIKHGKLISKPVGPNATGYEFDLYAFPELPLDQSQFIEQNFFDYADRTASDALRLHLTSNAAGWTPELISAWSRFVNALHLRHPDTKPELCAGAQALWEGSGKASQARIRTHQAAGRPRHFRRISCAPRPARTGQGKGQAHRQSLRQRDRRRTRKQNERGRHRRFGVAALPSHIRSSRGAIQHQGREGDDHAPHLANNAFCCGQRSTNIRQSKT
jgi:hypothetical protein